MTLSSFETFQVRSRSLALGYEAKAKVKARLFVEVEALVKHEAKAEAFENHEAKAEASLSKILEVEALKKPAS